MPLRFGLTPKVTLVFALFAVVLVAGVGVLAYTSGRTALEAAAVAALHSTAMEKQAAFEEWIDKRRMDLAMLASSPHVLDSLAAFAVARVDTPPGRPYTAAAQAAHDRLVAELRPWIDQQRDYLVLLVMEPNTGKVIAATDARDEGKFKENRPYFMHGKQGPYVQNPYYSLKFQAPALVVSAPLRAADGRLLGVLAGWPDLDDVQAILSRRPGWRQTDDAYLVNASGLFVTQPRFLADPAVLRRGVHTEAVKRCLAHHSGDVSAVDYHGNAAIMVYHWLPTRHLCLLVTIAQAEAFAPAHAFGRAMLLSGGVALLGALGLAWGLARTITRPILALQAGVARFGQGERQVRLPETSGDELGVLAREFNTMAATLSEHERDVHRRAVALEAANKELEAFAYSVSHDLRAPLRAIDGFARILREEYAAQLADEPRRYLRLIGDNAQHMGQLIDDLLTFSRLSRQPLKVQPVMPADLVHQVLADLRHEQGSRDIAIAIGELPICRADPALLRLVYVNLLTNACKFTRSRQEAYIEVGSYHTAEACVYFVKDNGVGFDMRYAHKLFGVFQRLHRAEEYEGTGVGLALVQRIIHRHGGRVWAEAGVDQGATFAFTLTGGASRA
jgi:signal transduction histidine kinase